MKQKRVYLSLSLSCGDETPLYHVTLVSDINECDTPDHCLLASVTGINTHRWPILALLLPDYIMFVYIDSLGSLTCNMPFNIELEDTRSIS